MHGQVHSMQACTGPNEVKRLNPRFFRALQQFGAGDAHGRRQILLARSLGKAQSNSVDGAALTEHSSLDSHVEVLQWTCFCLERILEEADLASN